MKSFSCVLGIFIVLLSSACITNVQTNTIQGRIISGTPATLGQFPWQVILKEDEYDNLKCGGSIIADSWVLTAAHCVYGLTSIFLVFGTIELEDNTHNMTSTEIYIHPQYSPPTLNDIALIKLPTALNFSSTIQPIAMVALSQASTSFVNVTAIIAGFGVMDDEYLDVSQVLLWAQVKIVNIGNCQAIYPNQDINETNICAVGDGNSNMSTCSGDSGGALIIITNGGAVQIGINSFVATDMCTQGYPSGYVRLTSYLAYVSSVTGLTLS